MDAQQPNTLDGRMKEYHIPKGRTDMVEDLVVKKVLTAPMAAILLRKVVEGDQTFSILTPAVGDTLGKAD